MAYLPTNDEVPAEFKITKPNLRPQLINDPEQSKIALGERVQTADGYWVQEQKYEAAEVVPTGGQSTITAEELDDIVRKHPGLLGVLHWGNLSRSGTGLSETFVDTHADQLDWNLLCLYAPLTAKIVEKHAKRINPHLLMKNPHLKGEFLEAVVDRLDMDRVVKELKLSSDFALRNREVLNPYDLMKYQQLDSKFWLTVLRSYHDLKTLPKFAHEIVTSQNNLDMDFVRGIGELQGAINARIARDPSLGLTVPFRILDGASMISRVKMDTMFITGLLEQPHTPEKRAEIKKLLAGHQTLTTELLEKHYNNPEDVQNIPLVATLLQRQTLPHSILRMVAPLLLTQPALRLAAVMRQKLNSEQIWVLINASETQQQSGIIVTLLLRTLHNTDNDHYLAIDAETTQKLTARVPWSLAITNGKLSADQVHNAVLTIPQYLDWKPFVANYRTCFTEDFIAQAHTQGCLGPLEWVLLLITEVKGKLVRVSNFSEKFMVEHGDRFYWWKHVDPKKLPFSMLNSKIPQTDDYKPYALTQSRTIIKDFVSVADWVTILRDEQLPLWFIDGISTFKIDMFWWKVIRYQNLSPEFVADHAAELADTNMFVKYQLRRILIKYGEEAVKTWLRNYRAFLESDALEFIQKDTALHALYKSIEEEDAAKARAELLKFAGSQDVPAAAQLPVVEVKEVKSQQHEVTSFEIVKVSEQSVLDDFAKRSAALQAQRSEEMRQAHPVHVSPATEAPKLTATAPAFVPSWLRSVVSESNATVSDPAPITTAVLTSLPIVTQSADGAITSSVPGSIAQP